MNEDEGWGLGFGVQVLLGAGAEVGVWGVWVLFKGWRREGERSGGVEVSRWEEMG